MSMKYLPNSGLALAIGVAAVSSIASVSTSEAQTFPNARLLELNGVAGTVEIRTAPGAAFSVQVIPGAKLSAQVQQAGSTIVVKGPIERNSRTYCSSYNRGSQRVEEIKVNNIKYQAADLPRIVVTAPDTIGLRIKRSMVGGTAGNVGGATIELNSCQNFTLGNVARDLEASLVGSSDFRSGSIGGKLEANLAGSGDGDFGSVGGPLELNLAGSGDAKIGRVAGKTEINIAGSGDADIVSTEGITEINIAGSGNVTIAGGRTQLKVNIAGSGDIRHSGTVIDPEINIIGSGDVSVARLEGRPSVSKMGSGGFQVD